MWITPVLYTILYKSRSTVLTLFVSVDRMYSPAICLFILLAVGYEYTLLNKDESFILEDIASISSWDISPAFSAIIVPPRI